MHIWNLNICRDNITITGGRNSYSPNGAEKNKIRSLFKSKHNNIFQVIKRPKYEKQIFKIFRKKIRISFWLQGKEGVLKQDTKAQNIKKRTDKFCKKNLCITRP